MRAYDAEVDKLRPAKLRVKLTSVPEPTRVAHKRSAVEWGFILLMIDINHYQCAMGTSILWFSTLGLWAGSRSTQCDGKEMMVLAGCVQARQLP